MPLEQRVAFCGPAAIRIGTFVHAPIVQRGVGCGEGEVVGRSGRAAVKIVGGEAI